MVHFKILQALALGHTIRKLLHQSAVGYWLSLRSISSGQPLAAALFLHKEQKSSPITEPAPVGGKVNGDLLKMAVLES